MDRVSQQNRLPGKSQHILDRPPPAQVRIPLLQHQGRPAKIIVSEGQKVQVGQPLTYSDNLFAVPVHASITGIVVSISAQQITINNCDTNTDTEHSSGTESATTPSHIANMSELFGDWSRRQFIKRIHSAGLVGLGGGCYPVAAKINKLGDSPADVLLINAAECDPSIRCDEALLYQYIEDLAAGICLTQLATHAKKTIIGIEADKSELGNELLNSIRKMCSQNVSENTELCVVASQYPNGAESLLMSHCIGKPLTSAEIHDSCLITFNIGTCYALARALLHQTPCTHRITTIIDSNLNTVNMRLPLGTPISELTANCDEEQQCSIVVGGDMMGKEVASTAVVTKASNCIQFIQLQNQRIVRPCIRCGLCVDACPVSLSPQFLLTHASSSSYTTLRTLQLQNCIECACCDRVCPSTIPLASIFAKAKEEVNQDNRSRELAEIAKARFDKRNARLENNKQREFKKLDRKQTTLNQDTKTGQQAKRQLVEEALQRARNRKQQQTVPPATGNTPSANRTKGS